MTFLAYIGLKFLAAGKWALVNWRTSLVFLGIVVVLVGTGLLFNRCKKRPTIDVKTVHTINVADEKERQAELQKTVTENTEVIKTVDGRTELQNVENAQKVAEIDAKVAELDKKIVEAKAQGKDVTQDELECLLVPENCK